MPSQVLLIIFNGNAERAAEIFSAVRPVLEDLSVEIKEGVILSGLDVRMRPALKHAERIWKKYGRPEGVTVTCGLDGCHSAGSWHYYGLALDFRTHYFDRMAAARITAELDKALSFRGFDVILHTTHIHVELDLDKELNYGISSEQLGNNRSDSFKHCCPFYPSALSNKNE